MKFSEFLSLVDTRQKENLGWRYGQTVFNTLMEVKPNIAECIRATSKDPFHIRDSEKSRIPAILSEIQSLWYEDESV